MKEIDFKTKQGTFKLVDGWPENYATFHGKDWLFSEHGTGCKIFYEIKNVEEYIGTVFYLDDDDFEDIMGKQKVYSCPQGGACESAELAFDLLMISMGCEISKMPNAKIFKIKEATE